MHWSEDFEHESLATAEEKKSFNKIMVNYTTEQDAIIGGYKAKKMVGKPYKLPESLDKLPDDNVRGEFTTQARKVLGIESAENIEALADLDLKAGIAEGVEVDEDLANMLKAVAVEKKWPKAIVQDIVTLHNQVQAKAREANAAKQEADKLATATATNEALIAHPDFGSKEKVAEQSELLRRAIQNKFGLTAEEYQEVGDAMADSMLTKNPVMARVMLKAFAPLAAEGSTDGGGGTGGGGGEKKQSPYEYKKARWPKSPSEWGKETDTWDTQGIQLRKMAGMK